MVGWDYWLDGHEFEQAPGVGDEQGGLVCFNPWGHKESDVTEWLNWTDNQNYPLIHGLKNGCCVHRHVSNIYLIVHLHQHSWVTRKEIFFFFSPSAVILNSKLCWKQMCCHPGFIVPFVEYRQYRFSIILKGPRSFGVISIDFNSKTWAALAPNKPLSFEILKPDIDFSSLAINVIFSNTKLFHLYKTICCLVKIPSLIIFSRSSK